MSDEVQARVYGWIEQQLQPMPGRGSLTRLALAHLNAADQLQQLQLYRVTPERVNEVKADLFRTATEVAMQWSGYQRFAVQAYFGDEREAGAYWPFAIAGQDQPKSLSATEPPNPVGMARQAMRHSEAFAKIIVTLTADANTNLLRQNQMFSDQLESMQKQYYTLLERSADVLAAVEERAAVRAREERSEKRRDMLAQRLMEAIPIVTNKIAAKFGGPKLFTSGGEGDNDAVLADMLKGLNDSTFDQLLGCFANPLHKAYVVELYKRLVVEPHKALAQQNGGAKEGKKADAH